MSPEVAVQTVVNMLVEHVPGAVQVEGAWDQVDVPNFRRVRVRAADGVVSWGSLPLGDGEAAVTGIPLQGGKGRVSNMPEVERRIREMSNLQWEAAEMFRAVGRWSEQFLGYSLDDWRYAQWLKPEQRGAFTSICLKLEDKGDEAAASVPYYEGLLSLRAWNLPAKFLSDKRTAADFVEKFLARSSCQNAFEHVHPHRRSLFNLRSRVWQPVPIDVDAVVSAASAAHQETFEIVFESYGKLTICGCD